jgi:hypothetical protein
MDGEATSSRKPNLRLVEIALVQAVFGLLFGALLDGGVMLTCFLVPVPAYWASVALLLARRRGRLRPADVAYIKGGWIVILPMGMAIAYAVYAAGWV